MMIFRTFPCEEDARDYRHKHGTGGWIFVPDDGSEPILFPVDMVPSDIFNHALTKGKGGNLLGHNKEG